jgi:hypothetical protein
MNYLPEGLSQTMWDAPLDILQRPYWSRIWIVQELSVAQYCWVNYGKNWKPGTGVFIHPSDTGIFRKVVRRTILQRKVEL